MTGTSVRTTVTDLPAGTSSFTGHKVALDLSDRPDGAPVSVWVKASTLTNLETLFIVLSSADGWAVYGMRPTVAGEWQQIGQAKGSPVASDALDWSAITDVYLRVDAAASGPYTGTIDWRDLRMGR
jgi:hypothetical protein